MLADQNITRELYNKYAEFYNSRSKNKKIAAYSELTSIRSGIEHRINDFKKRINRSVDFIEEELQFEAWNAAYDGDYNEDEGELNSTLKESLDTQRKNLIKKIKYQVSTYKYIEEPKKMLETDMELCENFFEGSNGKRKILLFKSEIENIIWIGERLHSYYCHSWAIVSVSDVIIKKNYPTNNIPKFLNLPEEEKEEILNNETYVPHHNVRNELIEDLEKIINSINDKSRFFHSNGKIKHTTVAKYAVNQSWFADKHGYSKRGLHEQIKKLYWMMNSNT